MRKVLIINRFYGYGTSSGGPVFSIRNLLREISTDHKISTFSLSEDFEKTTNISSVNKDFVFPNIENIFEGKGLSFFSKLYKRYNLIKNNDLIYLNSFFDIWFTLSFVLINTLFLNKTLVISPRGELMRGALSIHKHRKLIFIFLFKLLNLNRFITFHFTSNDEFIDALLIFPSISYFILPNMVSKPACRSNQVSSRSSIRVLYLSRITPKKGLLYAIELLSNFPSISLDIYGAIDDFDYYSKCLALSNSTNIICSYKGHMDLSNINFNDYVFSILPTHGENFGHSIYDSLSNGLPVVIGASTPWFKAVSNSKSSCILSFNKDSDLNSLKSLFNFLISNPEKSREESLKISYNSFKLNDIHSRLYSAYFDNL